MNRLLLLYIVLSFACALALHAQKTTPTTEFTLPSDTTRTAPAENKPEPREPQLELPDVLIWGKDQYHRRVDHKKAIAPDSPLLPQHQAAYEPMSIWFKKSAEKPHIETVDSLKIQQAWAKIMGGSYYTVIGDGGYWRKLEQGDVLGTAWFDRSEGQFANTKYAQGGLTGKVSYDVNPQTMAIGRAGLQQFTRGMHTTAFGFPNAVRSGQMGSLIADLRYDINSLSDGNIGFELGGMSMTTDTTNTAIDKTDNFYYQVHFDYTAQFKKTQLTATGQYTRETLESQRDSLTQKSGFGSVGIELSQPLSSLFSAAVAADFQSFTLDTLEAQTRVSPRARLNFTPSSSVGLSLRLSTGFHYNTFMDYWDQNSYLAHAIPRQPVEETFSFRLNGDVQLTDLIKFQGSFSRRWLESAYYWQADSLTGLINLKSLDGAKLTEIHLGVVAQLNERTRLQVDFIEYSDTISEDDSLFSNLNRIPYRSDFRLPIRASVQLLPDMYLTVTADILGERRKNLYTTDTFPSIGLFHLDVTKDFGENVMAILSVRNLLDTKYSMWEGYPEMGVRVLGGVRARF